MRRKEREEERRDNVCQHSRGKRREGEHRKVINLFSAVSRYDGSIVPSGTNENTHDLRLAMDLR